MATPSTVIWDAGPHTLAKLELLGKYLNAWFPIIGRGFGERGLTFVDAFAGPGEYTGGEHGSPLVAIRRSMRSDVLSSQCPLRFVLIESDARRKEHLAQLVDRRFPPAKRPSQMTIRIHHGRCEDVLRPAVQELQGWDDPIFVNLDSWGTGVPHSLVTGIGRGSSAEVLITFQTQFFIRFASTEAGSKGDEVFGGRAWREIAEHSDPSTKKRHLVDLYRESLNRAGFPYTLVFELVGVQGHELLLIFGTQVDRGVEKMKDAMWAVDPDGGTQFRDPRDPLQATLDFGGTPQLTQLGRQVIERIDDIGGSATLDDLKQWAITDTLFRGPHVTEAVSALVEEGRLDRTKARRHEDVIVSLNLFSKTP